MSSSGGYDSIGAILDIHAMVSGFLVEAVEDVPEGRWVEQVGGVVNHPAWTFSHLNAYAGVLLSMLDDLSVPGAYEEMERFGYGTVPVGDASAYLSKGELIGRFRERNARVAEVVRAKHGEYFPRRSREEFQPYSPTVGHLAITLLVAHPPHHLGQLRTWRRAVGIGEKG